MQMIHCLENTGVEGLVPDLLLISNIYFYLGLQFTVDSASWSKQVNLQNMLFILNLSRFIVKEKTDVSDVFMLNWSKKCSSSLNVL